MDQTLFQFTQMIYWVALSTWFGGVLFIAMAAPVIFHTLRQEKPILPGVLAVNLDHQHDTLLSGTLMLRLLAMTARLQWMSAGLLALCMVGHVFSIDLASSNLTAAWLRAALLIVAVLLLCIDQFVITPASIKARQTYIDFADEPDTANPAKDRFDQLQSRSMTLLLALLAALLALILLSANIAPYITQTP